VEEFVQDADELDIAFEPARGGGGSAQPSGRAACCICVLGVELQAKLEDTVGCVHGGEYPWPVGSRTSVTATYIATAI
jgi:hypothetical protein